MAEEELLAEPFSADAATPTPWAEARERSGADRRRSQHSDPPRPDRPANRPGLSVILLVLTCHHLPDPEA
jgi:hypothetical protein